MQVLQVRSGDDSGRAKRPALKASNKAAPKPADPKAVAKVSRRAQQRQEGVFKRRGGL